MAHQALCRPSLVATDFLGIRHEYLRQLGWPFVNTGFTLCVMLRTASMTLWPWTRKK